MTFVVDWALKKTNDLSIKGQTEMGDDAMRAVCHVRSQAGKSRVFCDWGWWSRLWMHFHVSTQAKACAFWL